MSQSNLSGEITRSAAADLSTKKYYILKQDSSGNVAIATLATDPIVGVLQNKPKSGEDALYRFLGTTKVVAGAPISINDKVTTNSSGKAIATTTDKDTVIGLALEAAGADGDIIEIQMSIYTLSK